MHVPATLVRGGTSKCWLFDQSAIPNTVDSLQWDSVERLLVSAYGAADPTQLDGVGGATPTTSKAAIIRRSELPNVNIEYLFGQVGIGIERVEWGSNCGNCATAIALWAVARGLVTVTGDLTRVVMRNTNTDAVLEAEVDTTGGQIHEFGTRTVPGTRAGGVAVGLTFLDPIGGATGTATPTGQVVDELTVNGMPAAVSLIDAGTPMALIDAAGIDCTATESLVEMRELVAALREVRHTAARRMGLDSSDDAVPKVGIVGKPCSYSTSMNEKVDAADHDVAIRMLSMNSPHPTIGLTSAVGVAVANLLEGSAVHTASTAPTASTIRIGTPGGVITVTCDDFASSEPRRVTVQRAARILCEADLFVPEPIPT